MIKLLAMFCVTCLSLDVFSSESGITIGMVDTAYKSGSNVTASYIGAYENYRYHLNYMDINIFSREVEGFHTETLSNGNQVCRDEESGQFADEGSCSGIDYDFAASIEAGYLFSGLLVPLELGLGTRLLGDTELGGDSAIYLKASIFSPSSKYFALMKIASSYSQLSLGMKFDNNLYN